MKSGKVTFRGLVIQMAMLAGISLLQGCASGRGPVAWMNWPFGEARYDQVEPMITPADGMDQDVLLDPVIPLPGIPDISSDPVMPSVDLATQTHTVQKGDTLSSIAARYGTTWKDLAAFNNLSDPNRILPGQELSIPASLGAPAAPVERLSAPTKTAPSSSATIKQGTSYVIQRGDSLAKIAKRSGLTVAELKAANGLTSDRIIAGKSLSIPRKGEVKTASPAPAIAEPAPAVADDVQSVAPEVPAPAAIVDAEPVATAATPVYDHVLYPGETLEDVARQYGCTQQDIMTLNNITDPASVKPGSKLLVPIPQ